jgi:YidC/Oxa1 family membrane protein insertase
MQQDNDSQRNLLVAIVLSVAVLLIWQMLYAGPKLKEEQERRQRIQQEQAQTKGQPGAPSTAPQTAPGAAPQPGTSAPSAVPAAPAPTREAALATGPRVAIDTPSLKGSIALKGGRIDDVVLAKYRETVTWCCSRPRGRRIPTTPSMAGSPAAAPRSRCRVPTLCGARRRRGP